PESRRTARRGRPAHAAQGFERRWHPPPEGDGSLDWPSLIVAWIECGQPYEWFWDLTLCEVSMIIEGMSRRKQAENNMLLSAARHTEGFARAKRLLRLKDILLKGGEREARKQPPAQIEARVRAWLSGRERKK